MVVANAAPLLDPTPEHTPDDSQSGQANTWLEIDQDETSPSFSNVWRAKARRVP